MKFFLQHFLYSATRLLQKGKRIKLKPENNGPSIEIIEIDGKYSIFFERTYQSELGQGSFGRVYKKWKFNPYDHKIKELAFKREIESDHKQIEFNKKQIELDKTRGELKDIKNKFKQIKSELDKKQIEFNQIKSKLNKKEIKSNQIKIELDQKQNEFKQIKIELDQKQIEFNEKQIELERKRMNLENEFGAHVYVCQINNKNEKLNNNKQSSMLGVKGYTWNKGKKGNIKREMIIELADKSLSDLINNYNNTNQEEIVKACYGLLSSIENLNGKDSMYMNHVFHRDIKPGNILIKNGEVKLGDFGLATTVKDHQSISGTKCYLPPYILNSNPPYSYEFVDIYAGLKTFFAVLYGIKLSNNDLKYQTIDPKFAELFMLLDSIPPQNLTMLWKFIKEKESHDKDIGYKIDLKKRFNEYSEELKELAIVHIEDGLSITYKEFEEMKGRIVGLLKEDEKAHVSTFFAIDRIHDIKELLRFVKCCDINRRQNELDKKSKVAKLISKGFRKIKKKKGDFSEMFKKEIKKLRIENEQKQKLENNAMQYIDKKIVSEEEDQYDIKQKDKQEKIKEINEFIKFEKKPQEIQFDENIILKEKSQEIKFINKDVKFQKKLQNNKQDQMNQKEINNKDENKSTYGNQSLCMVINDKTQDIVEKK